MREEKSVIKTTLSIKADLFLKGKFLAVSKGKTFSDILNEALEQYLKEHENELKKISEVIE